MAHMELLPLIPTHTLVATAPPSILPVAMAASNRVLLLGWCSPRWTSRRTGLSVASIEDSLDRSVGYDGLPFSGEFFLLASFSQSHFRILDDSVGTFLQSILGANPPSFAASRLDDRVFRSMVSCKEVALAVLRLGTFCLPGFQNGFLLLQ